MACANPLAMGEHDGILGLELAIGSGHSSSKIGLETTPSVMEPSEKGRGLYWRAN